MALLVVVLALQEMELLLRELLAVLVDLAVAAAEIQQQAAQEYFTFSTRRQL